MQVFRIYVTRYFHFYINIFVLPSISNLDEDIIITYSTGNDFKQLIMLGEHQQHQRVLE